MNDEELHGRMPWMPTEPMWSKREIQMRKTAQYEADEHKPKEMQWQAHRYRLPEKVKEQQAQRLKARFAAYSRRHLRQETELTKKPNWFRWTLVVGLVAWLIWRRLHH